MIKKGRVIDFKFLHLQGKYKNDLKFIIFSFLFIIGIVFGVVFSSENTVFKSFVKYYFDWYLSVRTESNAIRLFFVSFFSYALADILLFLFGTSILGIVLIPINIASLGVILGGFLSYSYSYLSLKGIAFNAIIFIPPMAVFSILYILLSKYSFNFSLILSKTIFSREKAVLIYNDFALFYRKHIIMICFCLPVSLLDILLCILFIGLFNFK